MITQQEINELQQVMECRMDAAMAVYWASYDGHGGQWSDGYQALCIVTGPDVGFKPSPLHNGIEDEESYEAENYYDELINDESKMLQWAQWLQDGIELSELCESDGFQAFASDTLGNDLFINDPERAARIHEYAENGLNGSKHCEIIQDWKDYLAISEYPDWVKTILSVQIDACEKWHIGNGSIDSIIG
jgi:hypothetical protein